MVWRSRVELFAGERATVFRRAPGDRGDVPSTDNWEGLAGAPDANVRSAKRDGALPRESR